MREDEIRQKSDFLDETYPDDLSQELSDECVNFERIFKSARSGRKSSSC